MAASEHTPHYSLSQFGPGDRPSWIDDYNADMQTLDTAVSGAQSDATEAKQSAAVNSQEIQQVSQQMGDMQDAMLTADNASNLFATKEELSSVAGIDAQYYHSVKRETLTISPNSSSAYTLKLPKYRAAYAGEIFSSIDGNGALKINQQGVYLIDCSFNFTTFTGSTEEVITVGIDLTPDPGGMSDTTRTYFTASNKSNDAIYRDYPVLSVRMCPIILNVDTTPSTLSFILQKLNAGTNVIETTYTEVACAVIRLHK